MGQRYFILLAEATKYRMHRIWEKCAFSTSMPLCGISFAESQRLTLVSLESHCPEMLDLKSFKILWFTIPYSKLNTFLSVWYSFFPLHLSNSQFFIHYPQIKLLVQYPNYRSLICSIYTYMFSLCSSYILLYRASVLVRSSGAIFHQLTARCPSLQLASTCFYFEPVARKRLEICLCMLLFISFPCSITRNGQSRTMFLVSFEPCIIRPMDQWGFCLLDVYVGYYSMNAYARAWKISRYPCNS